MFTLAFLTLMLCTIAMLEGSPLNDTNHSLTSANTAPYIEILRGRDGRDGRDGAPGPQGSRGPQGTTGLQGPPGPRSAGVTYTRWGKTTCPPGTERVYEGIAGGSDHRQIGGGANYLCMPEDPEYTLRFTSGVRDHSLVHGAEYQVYSAQNVHDHNVPCAVCYSSTRAAVMMIPAKTTCPQSWTREYYGYLMSAYKGTSSAPHYRTMFECVDKDQDSIPGTAPNTDGTQFWYVEASCNGLPCLPFGSYDPEKELNCVVCTK